MTSTATEEKATPRYVYKLVPPSMPVPDPLPEKLVVSELDAADGFVHLSTAPQVAGTLNNFFADQSRVFILRIEYPLCAAHIRWEDPSGTVCEPRPGKGLFPHLYNGLKLGKDEVESVRVIENNGGWESGLKTVEDWLVY